jgi:hypothetical protein
MSDSQVRHDLYGPIHKGLRAATSAMLVRLGSCDFADPAEARPALAELRALAAACAAHLGHEEDHVHPALEARRPGATAGLEADHERHHALFEGLEALAKTVEAAGPAGRGAAGRALYLGFAAFVAEDFAHMDREERTIQPLLHALFTDAELMAMEGAILAGLSPEKAAMFLGMMLPAGNPDQQFAILSGVRAAAPPAAFEAMLQGVARPSLTPERWARLERRLQAAA